LPEVSLIATGHGLCCAITSTFLDGDYRRLEQPAQCRAKTMRPSVYLQPRRASVTAAQPGPGPRHRQGRPPGPAGGPALHRPPGARNALIGRGQRRVWCPPGQPIPMSKPSSRIGPRCWLPCTPKRVGWAVYERLYGGKDLPIDSIRQLRQAWGQKEKPFPPLRGKKGAGWQTNYQRFEEPAPDLGQLLPRKTIAAMKALDSDLRPKALGRTSRRLYIVTARPGGAHKRPWWSQAGGEPGQL